MSTLTSKTINIAAELRELREIGRAGSDSQQRNIEEIVGRIEYEMSRTSETRVSRCTCIPAVTHDDYCATKSSAEPLPPPPPEILADALQDVVHTDPGPVRAAHALKAAEGQS